MSGWDFLDFRCFAEGADEAGADDAAGADGAGVLGDGVSEMTR